MRRCILTVLAVLSVVLGQPQPGAAQSGRLTQLPPPSACTMEDGDEVLCRDAGGLLGAQEPGISPDGKSVYVAGYFGDTLAVFSRNTNTGALTQLEGPDGCLAHDGDGVTCTDVAGLNGPATAVVSPDGKHVYVGGAANIAVFARHSATGKLTQLAGAEGCLVTPGGELGCTPLVGPVGPTRLVVSADGKHVYSAARNGDAIGVFARDRFTGALTQLPAPAGCIAENGDGIACTDATGLDGANGMVLSRNGKQLYVASIEGDTLAIFERDRTTGALTQFPAPFGCISDNGDGVTCTDAVALDGPGSLSMAKTGRQLYVASRTSNAITIFSRNAATGQLTQLAAPNGCVQMGGDGVTCTPVSPMFNPTAIAVTENGRHAYVTSPNSHAVVVFARDKKTGALTRLPAPDGCISNFGDGVTCTGGLALHGAIALAIPRNGKHVYVTSYGQSSIASFARQN